MDRWEQVKRRQVSQCGQSATRGPALLFDGYALRAKFAEAMEELDNACVRGEALRAPVAGLIRDASIGPVPMVESQMVINDTINRGNIHDAELLSTCRKRWRDTIPRMVDRLGEQARRKARGMAEAMLAASNRRVTARQPGGVA